MAGRDTNTSLMNFLLSTIKENKIFLKKCIAFSLTVGVLISLFLPHRYDSRISFYTQKSESSSGISSLDLSQLMLAGSPIASNHEFSILDILSSNDIYEKMLIKNYVSTGSSLIEFWTNSSFFGSDLSLTDLLNDRKILNNSVLKLKSRVQFNENRKSGLISITASLESKALSKEFIELFFQEISELLIDVNQKKSVEKVNFFEKITLNYKNQLDVLEDELVSFLKNNKNINSSELLTAEKNRLERQVNIISNTYFSLLKELEMSKINSNDDLPLLVILDAPKEAHKKSYPPRKLIVVLSLFMGLSYFMIILFFTNSNFRRRTIYLFKSS